MIAKTFCTLDWKVALFLLAGLVGCDTNTYDLELRPDGASLERDLTCYRGHEQDGKQVLNEFPDQELEHLDALYERHTTSDQGKKHHFHGTFAARTPNDIGGSGWYLRWDTELGSVSGYVERFRGEDDLTILLKQRQLAIDRTVDLLIGWLETELGKESGFVPLRAFLDESFRRDFHNVGLYLFSLTAVQEPDLQNSRTTAVRVLQTLIERGYIKPEEFPELARAVEDSIQRKSPQRLLARLQRLLAERMGVAPGEAIPDSLAFLETEVRAGQSLKSYLETTEEYHEKHEQWLLEKNTNPDAAKPDPSAILVEPLLQACFEMFFAARDRVNVSLELLHEPYRTNGGWNAEQKRVQWSQSITERDETEIWRLPAVLYAFWSEPNEESQRKAFGKVVLREKDLEDYVRWYLGLTDSEKRQWDAFLSALQPETLFVQLKEFRFEGEPAPGEEPSKNKSLLSDVPRGLLPADNSARKDGAH